MINEKCQGLLFQKVYPIEMVKVEEVNSKCLITISGNHLQNTVVDN